MTERIGLHSLKPAAGSRKPRKRIGRGEGSGTGKTSGRGHKGAGSRSGAQPTRRACFPSASGMLNRGSGMPAKTLRVGIPSTDRATIVGAPR